MERLNLGKARAVRAPLSRARRSHGDFLDMFFSSRRRLGSVPGGKLNDSR
jgi:hypothetical protein